MKIRGHLVHHAFPNYKYKLALSAFDNSFNLIILAYMYSYIINYLKTALLLAGFIITMSLYDQLHYYCHFGPYVNISWLKKLKLHHLKHHYRDNTRFFGVTNTFWDKVFGTY